MVKKILKIILIGIGVLVGCFFLLVIGIMIKDSQPSKSTNTPMVQTEYIDIQFTNEKAIKNDTYYFEPISFSYQDYENMNQYLRQNKPTFSYASYYKVEDALDMMNQSTYQKQQNGSLLDGEGKLDSDLLLKQIQVNNEKFLNEGNSVVKAFYKPMSVSDMRKITEIICTVINDCPTSITIQEVADTLLDLKMFERTGSASNAYVTDDLTFVFNPTMTSLYAGMQQITGQTSHDDETEKAVIVHEIMHLLQYGISDRNQDNGLEAGMCQMHNIPGNDDQLLVDCLWLPWILEASAELKMADYLGIETGTYEKKISYARSYNLSRFNQTSYALQDAVFSHSVKEAAQKLNEPSLIDFVNLLYSIEITQSDPEDFWESYSLDLSESEKLAIRMTIRQEVVSEMTHTYYANLSQALYEGKIKDLSTLFYMMRVWELDVYNHLEYTKDDSVEHAKPTIIYQQHLQEQLFEKLDIPLEELFQKYNDYCLYTQDGIHASLDLLNTNNELDCLRSSNFARNERMYQYYNSR